MHMCKRWANIANLSALSTQGGPHGASTDCGSEAVLLPLARIILIWACFGAGLAWVLLG